MIRCDREPSVALLVASACVIAWCMGCVTIRAAHAVASIMAL